jgi:hypothetical protein
VNEVKHHYLDHLTLAFEEMGRLFSFSVKVQKNSKCERSEASLLGSFDLGF